LQAWAVHGRAVSLRSSRSLRLALGPDPALTLTPTPVSTLVSGEVASLLGFVAEEYEEHI
jgi:hypothetical protein